MSAPTRILDMLVMLVDMSGVHLVFKKSPTLWTLVWIQVKVCSVSLLLHTTTVNNIASIKTGSLDVTVKAVTCTEVIESTHCRNVTQEYSYKILQTFAY